MAGWAFGTFLAFELLASRLAPTAAGLVESLAAALAIGWLVARARSGETPVRGAATALTAMAAAAALSGAASVGVFRHIALLGLACAAGAAIGSGGAVRLLALLGGLLGLASLARHLVVPTLDGRWESTLANPSLLACALCLTLPAALGLVRASASRLGRWGAVALAVPQAAALLGSGSRLALGALVVAGAVWAVGRASDRRMRLAGSLAAGALALVVAYAAWSPSRGHESSASHRVFIWRTALAVIDSRPLTGVGIGEFSSAFRRSRPWIGTGRSEALAVVRDAHCDLLHLAAESGVPAALAFGWLVAMACLRRPQAGAPNPTRTPLASPYGRQAGDEGRVALRIALVAWLLNGVGNGSLDVPAVAMLAWMAIGALGAEAREPRPVVRGRAVAAVLVSVVAFALGVAPGVAAIRVRAAAHAEPLGGAALTPDVERALTACDDLDAWLQLERELGSTEDRARLLRALIARRPLEPEPRARLAIALGPDDPEALEESAESVALDPYNPFYRRMLGDCLLRAGRSEEAVGQFAVALPLFERTLEVAAARSGDASPSAEALRAEIARVRSRLDTPSVGATIRPSPASRGEDES